MRLIKIKAFTHECVIEIYTSRMCKEVKINTARSDAECNI